jgi:hypothetical protein
MAFFVRCNCVGIEGFEGYVLSSYFRVHMITSLFFAVD